MSKRPISLRLDGAEDLLSALEDLGKRLGKTTLERALRQAAKPMLEAAKRNAPNDDGDLEKSLMIGKRLKRGEAGRVAYAAMMKATGGNKSSAVSAMREARRGAGTSFVQFYLGPRLGKGGGGHAHLVEFGVGPRFTKDGKLTGEVPADPFLRPAFDAEAQATIDRLKPILAKEVAKSKARGAKRKAKKG